MIELEALIIGRNYSVKNMKEKEFAARSRHSCGWKLLKPQCPCGWNARDGISSSTYGKSGMLLASLRWIYLGDELVPAMREGSNGESEIELPMDAQLVKLLVRELHITPTISATLMLPDDSIVMTVQPLGLPARTIVYNTYDTLNFAALSRIKLSSISTALDYGYPLLARSRNSRFGALLGSLVREEECITLTFSAGALQPKTVSLLSSMGYDADDVFLVGRPSNEGLLLKGLINCRTTCGSFIADADTIAPEEATCDDGAVSLQSIPSDPLGDRTFFGVLRPSTTSHTSSS